VLALDDRPALDVYLERLDAPDDARTDPAALTRFALTHPFGLSRRSGEEVRFIAEANFDDRSIGCIAEVPQGGLAWIMEGDASSVLDATISACTQAVEGLSGRAPLVSSRSTASPLGASSATRESMKKLRGSSRIRVAHRSPAPTPTAR
jgi:hypothetical protein